jgi:lipopolysaccharide export system protein LptA
MRIANAKRSQIPTGAKAIYLLGIARLSNAEKVLSRGNNMRGFKIRA